MQEKGVENFGEEKDTKVVRKNTFRREGNTARILEKRLDCLVATLTELKNKELGVKVTLNLHQGPEETLHKPLILG